MTASVTTEFRAVCREAGARPAVVEAGVSVDYAALGAWSEAVAVRLHRSGIRDGAPVAIMLPNSAAFIASFFGVARIGALAVPLNPGYRRQELEYYLGDTRPGAVIVSATTAPRVQEALETAAVSPLLLQLEGPGECELLDAGEARNGDIPAAGDHPLLLLYTSGSTGPPKRVIRSDAVVCDEVAALRRLFAITAEDRFLGAAPFFHVNGLVRSMLNAMLSGAALYPIASFSRREVLRLIQESRLTFFGGVPHMFALLAQPPHREAVRLDSLRIVFSSSAPLLGPDNEAFRAVYGMPIRQLYGSTETGTISYNDHPRIAENLESVGRGLPGVLLEVRDDEGRPVSHGTEGEIHVASPFAARDYEGNPEATRRSFREQWYLSGDLGCLDAGGYLRLTGRKSLMINRGGFKVNPYEVEEALRKHPKIADVVVGAAAGRHGDDIVCAMVVVREACSVEDLIGHCRRHIADYKIPSRIEFRDALAKTASGKIRRDVFGPFRC
jgi:long-chain acyl-CoA synthetase